MNNRKKILLAFALAASVAPARALDGDQAKVAAAAAACTVVASGLVYCVYQWATEARYWTVRGITKDVENILRTNLGQFNCKLHWDHKIQFHGLRNRSFARNQAEVTLNITLQNGQWHVRSVQMTAGLTQADIRNPGLLTVNATYGTAQNTFVSQK